MYHRPVSFHSLTLAAFASLFLAGCGSDSDSNLSSDTPPQIPEEAVLPLVFVHGGAGSASQYLSQAMRFASNGYPEDLIFAFEYHGIAPHNPDVLDAYIDNVLEQTGADQVYLVGHSMGTFVGYSGPLSATTMYEGYLMQPEKAAKVARYIGLDGRSSEECPGGVPCMGIFNNEEDGVVGTNTLYFTDQEHVEVATSGESFAAQFEFLTGVEPSTTEIIPQEGTVTVSGRSVIFPNNTGAEGGTLQIWAVDSDTGHRTDEEPLGTFEIDADGWWGPVELDPQTHYEWTLARDGLHTVHYYRQPIPRNTNMIRLNASAEGSLITANTNHGPDHSILVVTRDAEWVAVAEEGERDELWISTVSPQWGNQTQVNAIVEGATNANIALHLHDAEGTPATTTLDLLDYFPGLAFQSGVDVYMPAYLQDGKPDGTIRIRSIPRGDATATQVIQVPNWPSDNHRMSVIFNDWW
ncbi:alpha/beta fold hydrolase [uncultured Marinobacter sp.]|uniref:alpha/beta fold hydrolase n=1 Tax=uncultured Marinobacter sp. TaxID=187379 RepID=UPI0030DDC577